MKIKCLAVDDEPLALQQLKSYIERTPFLELVGLCQSAYDCMDILKNDDVHLMFVDINMPDINGLDFVKSLTIKPQIIFITAYNEFAYEGFQVDAIDYILKPIDYPTFLKAVNKAKMWFDMLQKNTDNKALSKVEDIFVKSDYKIVRIHIDEIKYIESANEYIKIYLDNNEIITTLMRLKNIEEQLPNHIFMRIHRSFIVQLSKIKAVDRSRVQLDNEIYIPVGEQYKDVFNAYVTKNFIA